jgi:hypothetical protein
MVRTQLLPSAPEATLAHISWLHANDEKVSHSRTSDLVSSEQASPS